MECEKKSAKEDYLTGILSNSLKLKEK